MGITSKNEGQADSFNKMVEFHPYGSVSEMVTALVKVPPQFYGKPASPPCVSVISSFYNAHHYFGETYASIINQTFQNYEWIIVDDGSTDPDAIALFRDLPKRSEKINTFYHGSNRGPAAARNTAVAHAQGKHLFFADLDELLDPTYLEKCVLFLETHPAISLVNSYSTGFQGQEYWCRYGFEKTPGLLAQNWISGRLLYRKSDFDALGGFDESLRFYEDWERWLRATAAGQKGWTIPEYLHAHRRTDDDLLSDSEKAEPERERVENLIRNRYEQAFSDHPPVVPTLERPSSFDVEALRHNIEVINDLGRTRNGKRVLCFFPHLVMGGADRFNLDLLRLLKERGYDLTIATTRADAVNTWQKNFFELTPDIHHLSNFLNSNHWLAYSKYLIRSRQIDVVMVSNSYLAYYFLPLLRSEFPDVAFVDFTHMHDAGWRVDGFPRLSRQFADYLDRQVVSSRYMLDYYEKHGCESSKLRACYTGIDSTVWESNPDSRVRLRANWGMSADTVLLLFPARLAPEKRPLFLLDIVNELVKQSQPIALTIVGAGALEREIKDKISELSLTDIVCLSPPVEPEHMADVYSAADILILPSEYEGISLVLYEAMAMGLPVVASSVGGQQELVRSGTGFLVEKGAADPAEVEAYVKVLKPLIENAGLRESTGRAARKHIVDHFSLSLMCSRMETIFEEAIELRRTGPAEQAPVRLAEELLCTALECAELERYWAEMTKSGEAIARVEAAIAGERVEFQRAIKELQEGKTWLEGQYEAWKHLAEQRQSTIDDLQIALADENTSSQATIEELQQGKEWLERQYLAWKQVSEQREASINELRRTFKRESNRLTLALTEVQESKDWLETQYNSWKYLAEERGNALQSLNASIAELQDGKSWLETQYNKWVEVAQQHERVLTQVKQQLEALESRYRDLEEKHALLEADRQKWMQIAEERARVIGTMENSQLWKMRSRLMRLRPQPNNQNNNQ